MYGFGEGLLRDVGITLDGTLREAVATQRSAAPKPVRQPEREAVGLLA